MTSNTSLVLGNLLENAAEVSLDEYLEVYKSRIVQESEKLFVREFLFPILGKEKIKHVVPQYPFLDSEGRSRRIDFGIVFNNKRIALEVNGETYHAEGIIPDENFDDNLNRQNEILNAGWFLLRFSYSQLQSSEWRPRVSNSIFYLLRKHLPEILSDRIVSPNYLQNSVLEALDYYRSKGWKKGIVILPTGTGKTFLSAFDTLKATGRILFIVHRIDILTQSREAFEKVYPKASLGLLTGTIKENVKESKILFASKDSLRSPEVLTSFDKDEFDYIIVDEVHHGQAPTYQLVLKYFEPKFFMLGLTATPDRMDRKDIFELFDYQKVFEYSLTDAIENGFLVPYSYYGLHDNIDYTKIKHNGIKYNVADLDDKLIIKERNEKIFEEYVSKGNLNKALGFCCSVKHANAMAKFFSERGVPSVAITSESPNRDQLLKGFRENKYTVAFTVDLFNEGVDFPDLRVLLFLRPTESKTIFFQQLGRGLRLCNGKENAVVIDFIGNYKKSNFARKFLAKKVTPKVNPITGRVEKFEYEYSPNCEVVFDAEVEEILDRQDTSEREITKEDLVDAYYKLVEKLNKKPSQDEINREGEFKVSRYLTIYGSWVNFLKEIGELTEFSYHFPQGTHLGHLLYIINTVGTGKIKGSHISPKYVRFSGGYDDGDIATFQRQTKYKLQAAMELGLLLDFRNDAVSDSFELVFTNDGKDVYEALKPLLKTINLSFSKKAKNSISWSMDCESSVNTSIKEFLDKNPDSKKTVSRVFLRMDAVSLMLRYLYTVQKLKVITRSAIYDDFFNAPFVKAYLDRHGLEIPTEDVRIRRIPFLLNILDAVGIIEQSTKEIEIKSFFPATNLVKILPSDTNEIADERGQRIVKFFKEAQKCEKSRHMEILERLFKPDEVSVLRETFGKEFLTQDYFLKIEDL